MGSCLRLQRTQFKFNINPNTEDKEVCENVNIWMTSIGLHKFCLQLLRVDITENGVTWRKNCDNSDIIRVWHIHPEAEVCEER